MLANSGGNQQEWSNPKRKACTYSIEDPRDWAPFESKWKRVREGGSPASNGGTGSQSMAMDFGMICGSDKSQNM